jgi:hypothetical protein
MNDPCSDITAWWIKFANLQENVPGLTSHLDSPWVDGDGSVPGHVFLFVVVTSRLLHARDYQYAQISYNNP